MERVNGFLLSAFLPQKGPLSSVGSPGESPETISRSRAWELVFSELPMLDGARRPLRDLHNVLVDVIIDDPPPLAGGVIFGCEPCGGPQDEGQCLVFGCSPGNGC